ncbi:cytochrome C oxidase subunit II [bacterium]|nr:MAG: cytochrome C oxidase subunit II [bacterium]
MNLPRLERTWLWLGGITMAFFFIIVLSLAVMADIEPPSYGQTIDPTKVSQTPPFDHPGLHQTGPKAYEAYYVGQVFSWNPASITIPVGSTVTFYVTSSDVVHGFSVPEADVNAEVMPGWVSRVEHTFLKPGDYPIICNQYCGIGHSAMFAHIIVK